MIKAADLQPPKRVQTPISNRGFDAQFLSSIPRYNPFLLDGVIVSVDSVRLKFSFRTTCYDYDSAERTDTLVKVLNALNSMDLWNERLFDVDFLPEHGFKCGAYQRTVQFRHLDGWSFSVLVGRFCTRDASGGSGFNTARQIAAEAVMDFNPNKVPRHAWCRISDILRAWSVSLPTVQRVDLALDFPIDRDLLTMQKRSGSVYRKIDDGSITEYIGDRSHHAAIKLYDKAAEVGMYTPCSRLEFTIDPKRFKSLSSLFPTVLSSAPLELSMDFEELPFQVQAVLLHPDLYEILKKKVNRNTWRKYDSMIQEYSNSNGENVLSLSTEQCVQIDRYLRSYLAELVSGK